jgi:hypothetical protein
MEMKIVTIYIDDDLQRKLAITADGYNSSLENYIVHMLELDMDDAERYFREEEGIDIFKS